MKKLFLIAAILLVTACEEIPQPYQGRFASADGKLEIVVGAKAVEVSSHKIDQIFMDHGDIFEAMFEGTLGVYISPSMFFKMMGNMHVPTAARMGWPAVQAGYEESDHLYDVYLVVKTVKEPTEMPMPTLKNSLHHAEVFYFQADKNISTPVNELTVQHWEKSTINTMEVQYGPLGLVKTWQVMGTADTDIKLYRQQ